MTRLRLLSKLALAAGLALGALALPAPSQASNCPRPILCADVYDPVLCADGKVYSNACYAYRACATGCVNIGRT